MWLAVVCTGVFLSRKPTLVTTSSRINLAVKLKKVLQSDRGLHNECNEG